MPTNLLDLVKGYITPDIVDKAPSYVGESGPATQKALSGILPTILAALMNQGSTSGGVQQIAQMLDSGRYDGSALASLGSFFGGGSSTQDALGAGKGILDSLFGSKLGGVTDLIARFSGVRPSSASSLMALATPIIMHVLGRQRAQAGGTIPALTALLGEQKGFLSGLLPAGLGALLGWPSLTSGLSEPGSTAAGATARAARDVTEVTSKRPGWLIPLGAIAALIVAWLLYLWSATPVTQVARETTRKLAELQLPGGIRLSVPEGTFNFTLAKWLESTTDTTVPKRFVFDNLNFETGSTQLTPESRPTVESLLVIMKAYPAVEVLVEGHTDSTGDPGANKKLSLDRAATVKGILVTGGIADSRIKTDGLGPDRPVASNDTEDGRAKNRRIELVVAKR